MNIQFIANACQIIEKDGFKILTDPWIDGPCFDEGWYHAHPIKYTMEEIMDVDLVYISHIHEDHLHPSTLKHFHKDTKFITLENNFVKKKLESMGFHQVHEMRSRLDRYHAGPFALTIFEPFQGNRYHESEVGNLIDSALLIDDGDYKLLNTNDNFPTKEALQSIECDAIQINYNNAGPYPDCFPNEKVDIEALRERNIQNIVDVVGNKEKLVIPFAGDFVYSDGTTRSNMSQGDVYGRLIEKDQTVELLNPYMTYHIKDMLAGDPYRKTMDRLFKKAVERLQRKLDQYNYAYDLHIYFTWTDSLRGEPRQAIVNTEQHHDMHRFFEYKIKKGQEYMYDILTHRTNLNNAEIGQHIEIVRRPQEYDPDFHMLIAFFHA